MKKICGYVFKAFKNVALYGSAWDYIKGVILGFQNGTVSLDATPITEIGAFLLGHWFWVILLAVLLITLVPPRFKKAQKKIQQKYAESEERKIEKLSDKVAEKVIEKIKIDSSRQRR